MVASGVLTYACTDLMNPRRRPEQAQPPLRNWDQPDAPTAVLTPSATNGGGSVDLNASFPVTTVVDVIATGYVVQHDNFAFYPDNNLAPGGDVSGTPMVSVIERFANGATSAFVFPFNNRLSADTITMVMNPGTSILSAARNPSSGLRRWPWYQYWTYQYIYCDTYTNPPCYTFSGSHTVSVVPKQASYSARADSSLYSIGETATIGMTTTPGAMAGSRTPIQVDTAQWVPDPDSLGGNSDDSVRVIGCTNYRWSDPTNNSGSDWLCDHAIVGAGTLTLIGHANGFRQSPSVHIGVRDPRLTLDANRSRVHAGDTVVFTPSWSDGITPVPYAWKWFPDSLPQPNQPDCGQAYLTCSQTVRVSGTMKVWVMRAGIKRAASKHVTVYSTFDLVADSNTAHLESSVRFTPRLDGKMTRAARWRWIPQNPSIQDATACTADTTCVKKMLTTGTMWAYLELTGGDSASTAVSVVDSSGASCSATSANPLLLRSCGDTSGAGMAKISLTCDPSTLTRTASTQCTAAASGNLVVTGWSFASPDERLSYSRASNVQSTFWNGRMVATGTVTVNGAIDGVAAQPGTALITVQARSGWNWKGDTSYARAAADTTWDCFPNNAHNRDSVILGWTVASCGNLTDVLTPDPTLGDGGISLQPVLDGPNTNLWYVTSMTTGLHEISQIIRDFRSDGTAYPVLSTDSVANGCKLYWPNYPDPTAFNLTRVNVDCMFMTGFKQYTALIDTIWVHERCHWQLDNDGFQRSPDIRAMAESTVAYDSADARQSICQQLNTVSAKIHNYSKYIDSSAARDYPDTNQFVYWGRDSTNSIWRRIWSRPEGVTPTDNGVCH